MAPIVGTTYIFLVMAELFFFRWALLGKVQRPGRHNTNSLFYFRKWFVNGLMDFSPTILRPCPVVANDDLLQRSMIMKGCGDNVAVARSPPFDTVRFILVNCFCLIAVNHILSYHFLKTSPQLVCSECLSLVLLLLYPLPCVLVILY